MKKTIIICLFLSLYSLTNAQNNSIAIKNSSFEKVMLENIKKLDTASFETLAELANNFARFGNAEKSRWEPFYYAAYSFMVRSYLSPDKSLIDGLADQAEQYFQKAEALEKNNSELTVLNSMIVSCRIMVDPMSRFSTLGPQVNQLLAKAKVQDASNPRIYLQEARMLSRTPEAFGGGKAVAKVSLDKALALYEKFVPKSAIAPGWGFEQAKALREKLN